MASARVKVHKERQKEMEIGKDVRGKAEPSPEFNRKRTNKRVVLKVCFAQIAAIPGWFGERVKFDRGRAKT